MLFFWTFCWSKDSEKKYYGVQKNTKQHNVFNINSIKKYYWAPNQHMIIISEGSYDWNNSYWKFCFAITEITFLNRIKQLF